MSSCRFLVAACVGCIGLTGLVPTGAQEALAQGVQYVRKYRDPAIQEIEERNRQAQEDRQAETRRIRDAQSKEETRKKEVETELRLDLAGFSKPASPDEFQPAFHFPPVRQFNTGNCWCFSTTSFFESEVNRLVGRKIKLSEMFTVYFECVEKARRYVRQRGVSWFDSGSEGNAVMMVWSRYGIVPAEAYRGVLHPDGRYDDSPMLIELKAYLDHVKQHELWDEDLVVGTARLILDKYMGRPPERFVFEGVERTPREFLADVLQLKLDDYVCVMSTLAAPFHAYTEYKVPANWWHSADYYNVPLEEFYGILLRAIGNGSTARLNGDVTEPGFDGVAGVAIIPACDIPRGSIGPDARELRIYNKSTDDDHDVHLVGMTRTTEADWFLVKDSAHEAQRSRWPGYMLYREDYIRLKTLTYIVHQDAVRAVVPDFPWRAAPENEAVPRAAGAPRG